MFTKLNQYLLTNHPLLWNTRIVQMLMVNVVLHIFFYLGGYSSIVAGDIQDHYYRSYGGGIITFSILCSIAVLILWLVFYLRNNALKAFYQLRKWHLVKELGLILLIVFTSITFFESFGYGQRVKARNITPYAQLVQEVNTINLAKAFIPTERQDYFILNPCEDWNNGSDNTAAYVTLQDTVNYNNDPNFAKVQAALRLPNAFSYLHYCQTFFRLTDSTSYQRSRKINSTVNNWVLNKQKDSIMAVIVKAMAICKKYNIELMLDPTTLTDLPFADSNHKITHLVKESQYVDANNPFPYYLAAYSLRNAFEFLDDCHSSDWRRNSDNERVLFELYCVLGLSVLLLCYRRFSKKVFLISIIGTAVWCIIIGLIGAASNSGAAVGGMYLFLFVVFTGISLAGLYNNSNKTVTGILLNWHVFMLPAVMMVIAMLMVEHYNNIPYLGIYDAGLHCRENPISCWVDKHIDIIGWANIPFALLYIMFVFNRLAKRWHTMPDE